MYEQKTDLIEVLEYIDPSGCTYQEWVNIGMALQHEGYDCAIWEDWSKRDIGRYHEGECAQKWRSFRGAPSPVTAGTIVQMAKDNGWSPASGLHELDWNDVIGKKDDLIVVNRNYLEGTEIQAPKVWNPVEQITTYLNTLFDVSDCIGYVFECWQNEDGKFLPQKGVWSRTAGELIRELNDCKGDIGSVFGDYNPEAGAWIRFNPLDGTGVRNDNVTEYRYALVESDETDISMQNSIMRELELPIACLVYSGGKSLHAIVRIDAPNYEEYRKRVDFLYKVCQKNGMKIDSQNRNPSRLSRIPGVQRGDKRQFLIDTNIGQPSWDAWREWIEGINDDLPDPEGMEDIWDNLPELAPPLIDGILRQGHKMLLAGPSKAGKSFALIELCCAIAEGRDWLGFNCTKGKVLYVNLELDRASCLHRFKDVYTALNWEARNLSNIDIWNLRGKSVPMDKLAPKLIRRAAKKNYAAVIIDPIYKVITGDENSAEQMANFCNQFDKVCTELKCAVIYCHHHSKGAQGGKRSMDRASGSGVFARDPDALLDMVELDLSESVIKQQKNAAACQVYLQELDDVGQDEALSSKVLSELAKKQIYGQRYTDLIERVKAAEKAAESFTAWRIDATLREFPKFPAVNVWFKYPRHECDNIGILADIEPEGERAPWQKGSDGRKKQAEKQRKSINSQLEIAYAALSINGEVTVEALADYWEITSKAVKNRVNNHKDFYYKNGVVYNRNNEN